MALTKEMHLDVSFRIRIQAAKHPLESRAESGSHLEIRTVRIRSPLGSSASSPMMTAKRDVPSGAWCGQGVSPSVITIIKLGRGFSSAAAAIPIRRSVPPPPDSSIKFPLRSDYGTPLFTSQERTVIGWPRKELTNPLTSAAAALRAV